MGVIFPCINGPIDTEQAECEQAGVPGGRGWHLSNICI